MWKWWLIVTWKRTTTKNNKAKISMIRQFNTNCFGQCIDVLSLLKCEHGPHTRLPSGYAVVNHN